MKRLKLYINGRVQGVWYRVHCFEKGKELGLTGFVKNLTDGRVYIEAQGEDSDLEALINWCKKGPPLASVKEIVHEFMHPLEGEDAFDIRR